MKHSPSYIKICTDLSERSNYPLGNLYVITGIVEFRIPGCPGPSKELDTEVRLMRGVNSFAAKYECTSLCSFMLFATTILKQSQLKCLYGQQGIYSYGSSIMRRTVF